MSDSHNTATADVPRKPGAPLGNQNAKGHGAPFGNINSQVHGRNSKRKALPIGRTPAGTRYCKRTACEHAARIKATLEATGGPLTEAQLSCVNSIARFEWLAQLAARLLADTPDLAIADKLRLMEAVGDHTASRVRAEKSLDIKAAEPTDPFSALDGDSK